ncbi:MAG: SirB1 family protein [Sandaracinaceae bacterium]
MRSHSSDPLDLVHAVRNEACSPERAALLLARDARPSLSIEDGLAALDRLAEPLGRIPEGSSASEQAHVLRAHLADGLGFRGDEEDYYAPQNSYLDRVMARRRGLPILLAIVYAAVGRRAGIEVEGIAFPGHFLARVGGADGVYIDPFRSGRLLSSADLKQLATRMMGSAARVTPAHLAPVGLRPLVVRMLLNLKNAHERRGDRPSTLLVCDRLVDLTDSPVFLRERGLCALALGAVAQAEADLTAYLERAPDASDRRAIQRQLSALSGRSTALS